MNNINFENVYLVGLGGVGSNLLFPLFYYLSSLKNGPSALTIIDGDKVEKSNLARQVFGTNDIDSNKATALFESLSGVLQGTNLNLYSVPQYLTEAIAKKGILDRSLIISAVDNHKTNKLIQDHCDSLQNVAYICGTGHLTHGSIIIHGKWKGEELLPKVTAFHPEIAEPEDRHPNEPSCMATADEGSPQIITTNVLGATVILQAARAILENEPVPHTVSYDAGNYRMLPQGPLHKLQDILETKTAAASAVVQ